MKVPTLLRPLESLANSPLKPVLDRLEGEFEKGKFRATVEGSKALIRLLPGHALGVDPLDESAVSWAKRAVNEGHLRWIVEGQLLGRPAQDCAATAPPNEGSA